MRFRYSFSSMIRVHHGPKRWVNLPYAVVVGALLLLGEGTDETASVACMVLLPLFAIQLIWPTVAGWAAIVGSWFVLVFLTMLWARLFLGITEFNNWVLILAGLAPLVPLYIFRPRFRDVRGAGSSEKDGPPQGDARPGDGT